MQVPFLSLKDVTEMHGEEIREAALLGVPAVSFFPRKEFLTVDVVLQEQGKEFKSRSAVEIREYVLACFVW